MRQSGQRNGVGEEQREVLGPAFDHLGGGAVHPGRESFGSVAEADGAFASLDVVGEGDVFEDVFADGTMASNCRSRRLVPREGTDRWPRPDCAPGRSPAFDG